MMTDIVFSRSYNAIEMPDYQHIPGAIEASNVRVSILIQAAELRFWRLDKKLFPAAIKGRNILVKFLSQMVASRLSSKRSDYKDILSLVQNANDPETGKMFSKSEIVAESSTLIVAGMFITFIGEGSEYTLTFFRQ